MGNFWSNFYNDVARELRRSRQGIQLLVQRRQTAIEQGRHDYVTEFFVFAVVILCCGLYLYLLQRELRRIIGDFFRTPRGIQVFDFMTHPIVILASIFWYIDLSYEGFCSLLPFACFWGPIQRYSRRALASLVRLPFFVAMVGTLGIFALAWKIVHWMKNFGLVQLLNEPQ